MASTEPQLRRQARYRQTAKGMAARDRYNRGPARRAALARYRASVKGRQRTAGVNARRIFAGSTYLGKAQSVTQAKAITAYARERLNEFVTRQQARAQAQGAA